MEKDMSYKEKFDEIIGLPFEFDKENYPDYLITLNPSRAIALIDITKFGRELEYKPFVVKGLPESGYVYYDDVTFNTEFIYKAIDVINPMEYAFEEVYDSEVKRDTYRLILRNGNYAIMIAPAYPEEEDSEKRMLESYIKEPPKSVFVL